MFLDVDTWPQPADPDRAVLGLERLRERAALAGDAELADFVDGLATNANGHALLKAVFGNSSFLTECVLRDLAFLRRLIDDGPDATLVAVLDEAEQSLAAETDQKRLMAGLRRMKNRAALLIALADIGGLWSFELVTGALSWTAEAALRLATRHLLRQTAARGAIELVDTARPETDSGLIVLAMGKLGAGELNFSSDIDLIILYDDARVHMAGGHEMARTFVRMARDLVRIMEERTADGYVFRTDLRLRPDPGATPLAVSVTGAEGYYGSMALNWERAAMIRARPVAGDLAAGQEFLHAISPFVWRRLLDFAAVQDIHSVKRRIHDAHGHGKFRVAGHDVKLGRGGIREIEFFVQAQQLLFGGRDPTYRAAQTIDALAILGKTGRTEPQIATALADDYRFLRRVEHRLQMIEDQQTHTLPDDETEVDALSTFLGFDDPALFRHQLQETLRRVGGEYDRLFEGAPEPPSRTSLVFVGADIDRDTLAAIGAMGFANPEAVVDTVRGWLHGRYRATRSERTRGMLHRLTPTILETLAKTPNPDGTLARLDEFLSRLPAGIQLFALFSSNPHLLRLMAEILGTSARLADHLARNPAQFDSVLMPGFLDEAALNGELEMMMATAPDYEETLNVLRRFTNDNRFRVGVQMLHGMERAEDYGRFLTDVAEAALCALGPRVQAEFARDRKSVV